MTACRVCPRNCGVDREKATGYCGAGSLPCVAGAMLHMWEEPCISGTQGAGTVFFCGCNLSCLFCQNYGINHTQAGERVDASRLCDIMLDLQAQGAHTIDLVTPTPHVDAIIPAIRMARAQGLSIPIVYNTNAYETPETLERLAGLVDVYLPDLKYVTPLVSARYSDCPDYFTVASQAIRIMQAQVGQLQCDAAGVAVRGLLVRHLVLPGALGETRKVLDFIAQELPKTTQISLMGQYVPCHKATFAPLDRRLLPREYERALAYCLSLGLENVYTQSLASADADYTPGFCVTHKIAGTKMNKS